MVVLFSRPIHKKCKHVSPETLKEKKKLNCTHTKLFWDLTTTCTKRRQHKIKRPNWLGGSKAIVFSVQLIVLFLSCHVYPVIGGKYFVNQKGVTKSPRSAGTLAALNQVIHGFPILTPISSANFRHNRFCAAAVKKRALELAAACQSSIRNQHSKSIDQSIFKMH